MKYIFWLYNIGAGWICREFIKNPIQIEWKEMIKTDYCNPNQITIIYSHSSGMSSNCDGLFLCI